MAQSPKSTMQRLSRLEKNSAELKGAIIQITHILVEQSERVDQRFKRIEEQLDVVTDRLDIVTDRLEGVTDRLDRLIAVTMKERTGHIERLLDIERRLKRLEERRGD